MTVILVALHDGKLAAIGRSYNRAEDGPMICSTAGTCEYAAEGVYGEPAKHRIFLPFWAAFRRHVSTALRHSGRVCDARLSKRL